MSRLCAMFHDRKGLNHLKMFTCYKVLYMCTFSIFNHHHLVAYCVSERKLGYFAGLLLVD